MATVRGIGVAVITSRCGGLRPLARRAAALLDAEPVLLVDDHQAEIDELDLLVEQGMRPHHDPGRARTRSEQRLAALARSSSTRSAAPPRCPRRSRRRSARARPAARAAPGWRVVLLGASTSVGASSTACPPESTTAAWPAARPPSCPSPPRPGAVAAWAVGRQGPRAISADCLPLPLGKRERQPRSKARATRRSCPGGRSAGLLATAWPAAAPGRPAGRTPPGSGTAPAPIPPARSSRHRGCPRRRRSGRANRGGPGSSRRSGRRPGRRPPAPS